MKIKPDKTIQPNKIKFQRQRNTEKMMDTLSKHRYGTTKGNTFGLGMQAQTNMKCVQRKNAIIRPRYNYRQLMFGVFIRCLVLMDV